MHFSKSEKLVVKCCSLQQSVDERFFLELSENLVQPMCWIPLCWSPKCILANRSIIKLVQERIVHSSHERFIKVLAIQYLSLHLQKVAILQTKMFIQVVINSLGKRISCTTSTVRTCVNLAGIRWNCLWTTSHNRTNHGDLIGDPVIG